MIVDLDLTRRHLVEALVDDAKTLAELLDAAEVPIVAISVLADGDVKLDLVVRVVRCDLSANRRALAAAPCH